MDSNRRWFRISNRNCVQLARVRATTYSEAANIAARRLRGRRASAVRTTGIAGLSGFFQGYVPLGNQGTLTSAGDPFHVTEE